MQSIRARRTRGGTSRDAIRASMRGDDVVVDFDSNDVPYYALAGALADARARWMATIVFRLACAFWFACGCAFGRASARWGPWARRRTKTARDVRETEAAEGSGRGARGGYGELERARARGDGWTRETRESKKKTSVTTRTSSSSVKRGDEKPSVSSTGTTGTRTTTNVAPMEVETNGNVEAAVEEEAESAFTCVDDEMEDAFVDESEIEPASEFTAGFGGAPTRFETKEEVEKSFSTREKTLEASSPSDEPTSAEDEDDSDSVETKEKMQFVADQVSEATSAMHAADDERSRARAEANKIEWEQRAVELAKQREEARRLKAAARKERRMKERTEEHKKEAEDRAKEADSLNEYRTAAQTTLKSEGLYFIAENGDLSSLLLRLGTHEDGKNIETSYKKALLKYHPDRSAARGGSLEDNARCEETFKLLQACRKLWENMGKPSASFTRTQSAHTRSWSRPPGASTTNSSSPPSNNAAYNMYQAGRRSAEAEECAKQAQANAEFVQKAKQEAKESEDRMRTEAARRWRELQKMQREKFTRESQAEMTRKDSLNKAREREELRKKLEEIKRSATFHTPNTDSPSSGKSTPSPTFNRTLSGTRVHINLKPVTSPGVDSQQPGSPQSKEQTLHRL